MSETPTLPVPPRHCRRAVTLAAVLVALLVGAFLAASSADARPRTQTNTGKAIADPGIAYFSGHFYLYGTGEHFPVASSTSWNRWTGGVDRAMASAQPKGLGTCGTFGHAEWAPQVFHSSGTKPYVMYYSACHAGRPCLGIATSAHPASGFSPVAGPICAPASAGKGAEAIDPSPYSAGGKRYMLFKSSVGNTSAWTIWAVQMNAAGTARAGTARAILRPGAKAEAPFLVNHGGRVWLFVSRNWFNTCDYSTDVYSAKSLTSGYTRVGALLTRASTGVCGPGGASITTAGTTYYIAYHGWAKGTPSSGKRIAFVAKLGWDKHGHPYVI